MPELGQRLGRFHRQAVEVERPGVVALPVPLLGEPGGLLPDRHHLEGHHVAPGLGAEPVGQAEVALVGLAREEEEARSVVEQIEFARLSHRRPWAENAVLFRTNETAFVQTKRKLLDECDLWCILSLPPGTFVNAGAGVKTSCPLTSCTLPCSTATAGWLAISGSIANRSQPMSCCFPMECTAD